MRLSLKIAALPTMFFLSPAIGSAEVTVVDRLALDKPPVVCAHLGNYGGYLEGGYPENSIAAIGHAIEIGADCVYITIQLTRDGHYVLMHDAQLSRTTNVAEVFPDGPSSHSGQETGRPKDIVADYTLEEVRQLRLIDGSDGGSHYVPALDDALELIDGQILAILSLKSFNEESLALLLAARETNNLILFSTMDRQWVQDGAAATGLSIQADEAFARNPVESLERLVEDFGPALVSVAVNTRSSQPLPPELVERTEQLGLRLALYLRFADVDLTFGDAARWQAALSSGATIFITDHPHQLLEMMGR